MISGRHGMLSKKTRSKAASGLMARDALDAPPVKSRAVTGIDQDIKPNKALWHLGAKMAELKSVR